ncbi:MAG: efflux RND transporter periplasmic adaptor subunit [Clostridiales bacterium]|nr:efflux RND transporter periplasmic adaptor subunit [Clostridiales bacterium]
MKKILSKKMIIICLALIVLSVGGYYYYDYSLQVEVELYETERGPVVEIIVEDGYIEAVHTAEIQSNVSGTVDNVYVDVGDSVNEGDVILSFDEDILLLQIERLESEIKALDFQLLEASKPADQERIRNASILVSQAKSTRDKAKKDYDDNLSLYSSGALSKNALDLSEKLYNDSVKAYNIAINDSNLINKGISVNVISQYNASIDALYTQKKILERQLLDYSIASPMSGVVLSKYVKVGHYAMMGQQLLEVADLSELRLICEILEDDYNAITVDTNVRLYDKHNKVYYDAVVNKVYPKSESSISDLGIRQNRVRIEVVPTNPLEGYIVGQELDVEFIIHDIQAVRVPVDAVYKSNGDYFVFIVKDNVLISQQIEVGIEGEDYYEIKSGLNAGDKIVKVINNDLEEGQKVK